VAYQQKNVVYSNPYSPSSFAKALLTADQKSFEDCAVHHLKASICSRR